jgi:hypothetical protein
LATLPGLNFMRKNVTTKKYNRARLIREPKIEAGKEEETFLEFTEHV